MRLRRSSPFFRARNGLFAEQTLWQSGLANHRIQRTGRDLVVEIVSRHVNEAYIVVYNRAISAMTAGTLPMQHKAVLFNDRDEFAKGAFQAGQTTGSQTVESLSGFLPQSANQKKRQAHLRRTCRGTRRRRSRERAGSCSAATSFK